MKSNNVIWKNAKIKKFVGLNRWSAIIALIKRNREVDASKKILFVHIPKTAGRSLIDTYSDYFADAHHSTALMYKTAYNVKGIDFVTVVRNPWERLYSSYNFLIQGGLTEYDKLIGENIKEESSDFNSFIKDWLVKNTVYSYMHFVPQVDFIFGWRNEPLDCHIIRFENLETEWDLFAAKHALPRQPLPKNNVSAKGNYKEAYSLESQEIIRKLYAKDIKFLKYEF